MTDDEYDAAEWTASDLAHPANDRTRRVTALLVPGFALIGVVAMLSNDGPRSPLRLAVAAAIFSTAVPVGLLMFRTPLDHTWWKRGERAWPKGAWFVLYADIGVAGVLFTFTNPALALSGATLFALISVHAGHFLTPKVALAHVAFTSTAIVTLSILVWFSDEHDAGSVAMRCLVALVVVNATALLVQEFTANAHNTSLARLDLATQDPLTGLSNRRGFIRRVTSMLAADSETGFIAVDIDQFKSVNDHYGHAAGDAVLLRLGTRLRMLAGPESVVARTGGEEFAVAAHNRTCDIAALAEKLRRGAHDPTDEIPVTVSIGAVVGRADAHAQSALRDPDTLIAECLAAADTALYEAKSLGGNTVVTREIPPDSTQAGTQAS